VVAIAVAINLVMSTLPVSLTQIDVSNQKLFTLSEQTKQIVKGLNQGITVYWLVQPGSEDVTVEKLLDNYKDLSDKIKVKHIDPVEQPNLQQNTPPRIYIIIR
jgi:ABC-type uncharacterized transport system involved in gliding motility auxiliary subunit